MEKKERRDSNYFARVKPINHDFAIKKAKKLGYSLSEFTDKFIEALRLKEKKSKK